MLLNYNSFLYSENASDQCINILMVLKYIADLIVCDGDSNIYIRKCSKV